MQCTVVITVWHENFTWNLILQFYGWWQNRKIKIRKLYTNLVYIITRLRKKLGFCKIKIPTTFRPNDSKANQNLTTIKFSCYMVIELAIFYVCVWCHAKVDLMLMALEQKNVIGAHIEQYINLNIGCY